jgi:hypothetical protein
MRRAQLRQVHHNLDLRCHGLHLRHIARPLLPSFFTASRALSRLWLGHLANLDPNMPVQRYEWDISGDLLDIDIRYLASFRRVLSRITRGRQRGVLGNCVVGRSIRW